MKLYPKPNLPKEEQGFTEEEVRKGIIWLYADVTCTKCGKVQTAAAAGSITNGSCIKCGGRTE